VGDWWVVKKWSQGMWSGWQHKRYDVLRKEKLADAACYVLQYGDTAAPGSGTRTLYYVRCDNWRTVRSDDFVENQGQVIGPVTMDFPDGMFGPLPADPQLPSFPIGAATPQPHASSPGSLDPLRQSSCPADPARLNSFRAETDSTGGRPVKLVGKTYEAVSELVMPSDTGGADVPYRYALQLWNEGCPWRVYEEMGSCDPVTGTRQPEEQSWLIAWGRLKK
jgi:hypothetical protein